MGVTLGARTKVGVTEAEARVAIVEGQQVDGYDQGRLLSTEPSTTFTR